MVVWGWGIKGLITKRLEETLGCGGYVHYLNCDDIFMDIKIVHLKYVQVIICQLYLIKAGGWETRERILDHRTIHFISKNR